MQINGQSDTRHFCTCGDELVRGDAVCRQCWTTIRDNWRDKLKAAEAELEIYKVALQEACDAVGSWGAYAGEYFQEKHNLADDCKPETHIREAIQAIYSKKKP